MQTNRKLYVLTQASISKYWRPTTISSPGQLDWYIRYKSWYRNVAVRCAAFINVKTEQECYDTCAKLSNISALSVTMWPTRFHVTNSVPFNVSSFNCLQTVRLYNVNVIDIGTLARVPHIYLNTVFSSINIGRLGTHKLLSITNCDIIGDFTAFTRVHTLWVNSCKQYNDKVTTLAIFDGVTSLQAVCLHDICDLAGLTTVKYLLVHTCCKLATIHHAQHVPYLWIRACYNLVNAHVLANTRTQQLTYCRGDFKYNTEKPFPVPLSQYIHENGYLISSNPIDELYHDTQ